MEFSGLPANTQVLHQVFAPLDIHLPIWAALAGEVPGDLLVDDQAHPTAALLRCQSRLYLAGQPASKTFIDRLCAAFSGIYAGSIPGLDEFSLCFSAGWGGILEDILQTRLPLMVQRQYYEIQPQAAAGSQQAHPGISLRPADCHLLASSLANLDDLRAEMCSERPSVDEFLQKSFGLCPVTEESLIGWCLSEYNLAQRCEVGIAVFPPYQRRGIATWLTTAFLNQASQRGINRVGWHCYASNQASGATARKAGLRMVCEYPALIGITDPVINLGAHGNQFFWRNEFETALAWYRQAARQDAPAWIYWNAACCAARCSLHAEAFALLNAALDHGFDAPERLATSPHLQTLRALPGWQDILRRV